MCALVHVSPSQTSEASDAHVGLRRMLQERGGLVVRTHIFQRHFAHFMANGQNSVIRSEHYMAIVPRNSWRAGAALKT
jgi:hypothetical protein